MMKDLKAWDVVWERVQTHFVELSARVASVHPELHSSSYRWSSEVFPLRATLSISEPGPAGDELVVVSVSGQVKEKMLAMSADLSRGDGFIVADGPSAQVAIADAQVDLLMALSRWLDDVDNFLVRNVPPLLVQEL